MVKPIYVSMLVAFFILGGYTKLHEMNINKKISRLEAQIEELQSEVTLSLYAIYLLFEHKHVYHDGSVKIGAGDEIRE